MVNKIKIVDNDRFNELGLLINDNFCKVYELNCLLNSPYDYLFGYYDGDLLVGFIHVNKLYENMDIVNVVVDINYRNKGIASLLISFVCGYFVDVQNVFLEVNENNSVAISLYKKNNFEVINIRKRYYGNDDALIMKRVVENERC
ncbi:MAG: GNAT family N-acetyltransferase [Candidatus Coprovivens sp.]